MSDWDKTVRGSQFLEALPRFVKLIAEELQKANQERQLRSEELGSIRRELHGIAIELRVANTLREERNAMLAEQTRAMKKQSDAGDKPRREPEANCLNDLWTQYEMFKLRWMADHGLSLKALEVVYGEYLSELQDEAAEGGESLWDALNGSSFLDYLEEHGFHGMLWPCYDEWLESDR